MAKSIAYYARTYCSRTHLGAHVYTHYIYHTNKSYEIQLRKMYSGSKYKTMHILIYTVSTKAWNIQRKVLTNNIISLTW